MCSIALVEAGLPTLRYAVLTAGVADKLPVILTAGAALAIAYALTQMAPAATEGILPNNKVLNSALIPAYRLLPYDKVGDEVYVTILIATSNGWASRVGLFCKGVERFDILQ